MPHVITEAKSDSKRPPTAESTVCFFVAPIGDGESDTRKRSDQVLKYVVKPAALECGYEAKRADEISEPGIITTQIIQHIIDDPMVVADLTGTNPNVFYELAIRHALRKPYAQIIQKGDRIPFDVAAVRTIEVDHRDLDSVNNAREELIKQMQSMQGAKKVESPISVAVDLELLRASGNPEQRQLADVLTGVAELKSLVEKKLGDPTVILPPGYLRELFGRDFAEVPRRPRFHPGMIEDLAMTMRHLNDTLSATDREVHREECQDLLIRMSRVLAMMASESGMPPQYFEEMVFSRRRKPSEKG